jgi:ribonucleoside-diphosphate reductase alpha chain
MTVLRRRYLKKNENGDPVESPRDMFWRVARVIAEPDAMYGADSRETDGTAMRFYEMMATGKFEPNSPTLMNAGRPLGQLSACFVLPVPDSLEGIYETLKHMALIHQSGGGTGFGFSRLRPRGDVVRSTMGVASGPVSFMEVYDASTEAVKQGGTRRGANMGILRVDHPDILEFIDCKAEKHKITNFNISVAVTDEFMESVRRGEPYYLRSPRTGEPVGQMDAREVFDRIVYGAWRNGEPGVFFIDEANRHNPVPHTGSYEATNPCGEQCLLPYDVCNLGSVNVGAFVEEGRIDWEGLGKTVRAAAHFLDNVIDANQYPLPQIDDLSKRIRRVGLGIMGWADMLVRLDVPYGSRRSTELGREVMRFVDEEAKAESERLAGGRGVFPDWEGSIWGPDETCARDEMGERIRPIRPLRNCNVTTVAPTGTISIIAGCSSGIEPHFAVAFMRNQAGTLMPDVNPDFVERAEAGGWYSEDLMCRIADEGHIHFDEVPAEVQEVFVTAHDVTPEQHIRMQAAFQRNTDAAISKTCNFSESATEEDVRAIFELAHELRCKGVTVYRDGSRDQQVLSTGRTAKKVQGESGEVAEAEALRGDEWLERIEDSERLHEAAGRASASQRAPRPDAEDRLAAGLDVRHDQRGRAEPAFRGVRGAGQGRRACDGRCRGGRPPDQPGATLGHLDAGSVQAAARHLLGSGGRVRPEQGALEPGCHRPGDRAIPGGEGGRPAVAPDPGSRRGEDVERRHPDGGESDHLALRGAGGADVHRHLSGLRDRAHVRGRLCEVSRVRLLGVRLTR